MLEMRNSNGREPMSNSSQPQDRREVVRVFERLTGQNRWTGVAYDAASGSVVATASSGTRAATRDALDRALARFAQGRSNGPRVQGGADGGSAQPQPGMRRTDPGRRPGLSLAHAR